MSLSKNKKEALSKPPFFISYLITDPLEYGDRIENITNALTKSFQNHKVDIVCFRDKQTKDIKKLAKATIDISKKNDIPKVLINSDIALACELGFDGVHLNSQQFDKIEFSKNKNLYTIISCHSEVEILLAKKYCADAVTISPIFYKEKKNPPLGCDVLKQLVEKYQDDKFKIIALGGIVTDNQIEQIKETHCDGFASIRYFTK